MKLIEPEAEGPIEGEEPIVTAPRPPHRRVSVSFLFTLTVLIGTVVAIYVVFPPRHNVVLTEAIEAHQEADPKWELVDPSPELLQGWAIAVGGKDFPMPPAGTKVLAARQTTILGRSTAIMRLAVGTDEVTYVVQRAKGMAPKSSDRTEDDVHAIAWRQGKYTAVAVGPASQAWVPTIHPK
jgi:hypothetical protein